MECAKLNLAEPQNVNENMRRVVCCRQLLFHDISGQLGENQTTSTNAEHKTSITGCQVKAKGLN